MLVPLILNTNLSYSSFVCLIYFHPRGFVIPILYINTFSNDVSFGRSKIFFCKSDVNALLTSSSPNISSSSNNPPPDVFYSTALSKPLLFSVLSFVSTCFFVDVLLVEGFPVFLLYRA